MPGAAEPREPAAQSSRASRGGPRRCRAWWLRGPCRVIMSIYLPPISPMDCARSPQRMCVDPDSLTRRFRPSIDCPVIELCLIVSALRVRARRFFENECEIVSGPGAGRPTIPFGLPLSMLRLRRLGPGRKRSARPESTTSEGSGGAGQAPPRSPGTPGSRAHGGEAPEGDRPLREAPGGRQGARVAPARALRTPSTRCSWRTDAAGSSGATP